MKCAADWQYRLLFDTTPEAILVLDVQTGFVSDANPPLLALLGYAWPEIVGHTLSEVDLTENDAEAEALIVALRGRPTLGFERRVRMGRGGQRAIKVDAYLGGEKAAEFVQCHLQECAVPPARPLTLRFLAEAVPEKISIVRADGYVEFVNSPWLDYLGFSVRQMQDARWHQFTHPEDSAATTEAWQRAMATGTPTSFERRMRRRDGSYRWHLSRVRALLNGSNPPTMWIGVDTDIDDQKSEASLLAASVNNRTLELKELVNQMETFSYTMAHDLRGPLRTMQGYAQILAEDYAPVLDLAARNYLSLISVAARRMHKLVTDVLIYTRITAEPPAVVPVALEPVVGSLVIELPALVRALQVQGELPVVWGDPAALNRVFSNLLSNALKFVPPDTLPAIELFALAEGEWTTIYFADNGLGVPECDQERIFRMFERIPGSNLNDGAGIGLAIVRKAVARMGGTVGVESNPGKGSTFWVKLRRYQAPAS